MDQEKVTVLRRIVEELYAEHQGTLLFHGWHHIAFVTKKAREFALSIGANVFLVESAALVHDVNYIVKVNSEPEDGAELRDQLLKKSRYAPDEMAKIEEIVMGAHLANRGKDETNEVKALADADTLFKALPITPILFASKYIQQNKVDIRSLSRKIVAEQKPLLEAGIYFYTDIAKEKYLRWAEGNINLWLNVEEALKDSDVQELLADATKRGVL